jgi:hypothetical protein
LAQVDPRKLAMLFERVRMLSPAERRPYLERECADDPELREHVLNLAIQDEQASQGRNILSASRTDPRGLETTVDLSSVERPGRSALGARPPVKAKLVVGSGPSPTVVLQHQLHDRLRMGVLIIFFGFAVFLASDLWTEKYADGLMNPTLVAHVVVVGATVMDWASFIVTSSPVTSSSAIGVEFPTSSSFSIMGSCGTCSRMVRMIHR